MRPDNCAATAADDFRTMCDTFFVEKYLSFFDKNILTNGGRCDILRSMKGENSMPKISSKLSTTLSMLLCGALAAVIAVICFRMPEWLGWLLFVFGKPSEVFVPTLCTVYFTALIAYGAIALLFVLLCRIRRGEVFTSGNVSCLRALSWLCLCAAACYAACPFGLSPSRRSSRSLVHSWAQYSALSKTHLKKPSSSRRKTI